MNHEQLDRPGGMARGRLLEPLRVPDYRRRLIGQTLSLLGDGVFLVALAWQVYGISGAPAALGAVGIAMTVPTITCLLLGGAISDRRDRRRLMLAADLARAVVLALLAAAALTGRLTLGEIIVAAALYGTATAFFDPAADALVVELLAPEQLGRANSLEQLVRPVALTLAGPALGGFAVAVTGAGGAFALDALSFAASALCLAAIRTRTPRVRPGAAGHDPAPAPLRAQIGEGLRYVSGQPWLWATLIAAALAYLLFIGPTELLLPFLVKRELHLGAGDLGLIYAAGGIGALIAAVVVGRRGTPRAPMRFTIGVWTAATLALAGYGVARSELGLALACLVFNALETAGTIVWMTLKQRLVPAGLLGRVSSLDWLVSIGLVPVSYGLTGPLSAAIGVRATLIGAGLTGGLVTAAGLLVPGVTAPDRAGDRVSGLIRLGRIPLSDGGE